MVDSFPRRSARTQRFALGAPRNITVADDGSGVAFLRSPAGDNPSNDLWYLDVVSGQEHMLVDASILLEPDAKLPAAERTRRERAREGASGIVRYVADASLKHFVFALNGQLFRSEHNGTTSAIDCAAGAFDPRFNTDSTLVAYVADGALRITGGNGDRELLGDRDPDVTWGLAEFIAAEEMRRSRGFWWSPSGDKLAVCRVDNRPVDQWNLADPTEPKSPTRTVRYPSAGTKNALVDLVIIDLEGNRIPIKWQRDEFEYLADVSWRTTNELLVTVQTRDQKTMACLAVDVADGAVSEVARFSDDHWIDIVAGVPAWVGEHLVMILDDETSRRFTVDGTPVTAEDQQITGVVSVRDDHVIATVATKPSERSIARIDLDGTMTPLFDSAGVISAVSGGDTFVTIERSLSFSGTKTTVHTDSGPHTIISNAADPQLATNITLLELGDHKMPAALVLPTNHRVGDKLPVLLDPYGGPHAQRVLASRDGYLTSQWFADQGFAVLIIDGRGTSAKGGKWERAVWQSLGHATVSDQADGLAAAGQLFPYLDLNRVAIRGWSFGGYLAALAVCLRPDTFHAAIAGAPVTDWALYDTHYTERYMGHPHTSPESYRSEAVTTWADQLDRPLLLIHGLADDNVVAAHTLQLSRALLAAGKPHEVLPLPGVSHMTPQEEVAENLLLHQLDFLRRSLPDSTLG